MLTSTLQASERPPLWTGHWTEGLTQRRLILRLHRSAAQATKVVNMTNLDASGLEERLLVCFANEADVDTPCAVRQQRQTRAGAVCGCAVDHAALLTYVTPPRARPTPHSGRFCDLSGQNSITSLFIGRFRCNFRI